MGRRVTVVQQSSGGGGSSTVQKDPFEQPCFSSYTGSYNYSTGFFTWDHNLNVHNWIIGDNNAYSQYRSDNSSQNTEFINSQGSDNWFNSWNEPSGSTDRINLITYSGYLGHQMFLNGSCNGSATPWFTHTTGSGYRAYAFRDVGTVPGETHQDYAVFVQFGGTFRTCSRSASEYWMGYNYNKLPTVNIPDGYGSQLHSGVSYNRKRNKIAFMETNDSYTFQPFVWSNCPNLRSYAHSQNWYQGQADQAAARNIDNSALSSYFNNTSNRSPSSGTGSYGTSTGKPTNQTTEDQRRGHLVLCDNDRIVFHQMIPSYGAWTARWNSPSVDGNGNCQGAIRNTSWTTSYGFEQGVRYGSRFTQTSDGRYIAMYCPSYYYGAGIMITITRVSDGKSLHTTWNTSSESVVPCPFGKSNFLMVSSRNTDGGQGVRFTQFNCDFRFGNTADNSDPGMVDSIDASSYQFDSCYYTTSYPGIIPAIYNTSLFNTETSDIKDGYDPYTT